MTFAEDYDRWRRATESMGDNGWSRGYSDVWVDGEGNPIKLLTRRPDNAKWSVSPRLYSAFNVYARLGLSPAIMYCLELDIYSTDGSNTIVQHSRYSKLWIDCVPQLPTRSGQNWYFINGPSIYQWREETNALVERVRMTLVDTKLRVRVTNRGVKNESGGGR